MIPECTWPRCRSFSVWYTPLENNFLTGYTERGHDMFSLFRKKVLVVEDEPALRKALMEKLTSAGYAVIAAKDGQEGLALAMSKKPKVVLLDLMLPRMDGMSVLDRLRKDSWGANVPVIILTNLMATDGYKKLAEEFHVYDYVVKSDRTLEEVVSKVSGAIKNVADSS